MVEQRANRSGQALGPYQLTRLLGAGGFGEVYEADHQLLQQKRAIKLLLERHFHDPNQRERFLREARTLATLEHPNILPVLEVGEEGTILYLVMPFYRQGTLNDLLKPRTTPLPLAEVERYLTQMCAAVGYAHARHIAHLDLKPENMLIHEDGRLVLSDFGLAHLIKQGRLEAGSSASWGTPYYMAPEQIRGVPEQRSDLYALGVILYQLLTNQRPFTGNAPEAVMMKHLLEAPPPLRAVSPAAPATLEPVLHKALEKQPEARYPTAEALLADFRAVVSNPSLLSAQLPALSMSPTVNVPTPVVQPTTPVPPERASHAAEPANMTQTTGTGPTWCEIKLNYLNYSPNCGQIATGRCTTCGRAFCDTHRGYDARDGFGKPYVHVDSPYFNMCEPCSAAEERKRQEEAQAQTPSYFSSGAAQTALRTASVPPVDIYETRRQWKNGLFGLGGRYGDVVIPIGRGWILGEFKWKYLKGGRKSYNDGPNPTEYYGGSDTVENWLTALLENNDNYSYGLPIFSYGLGRVRPYSGGYEVLGMGKSGFAGDWREVAQAVKRLAGALS